MQVNINFPNIVFKKKTLILDSQLKRTLVQGNYYRRTHLFTRSACKTPLVTDCTLLTTRSTRSTHLSTRSTRLSTRSTRFSTRSTRLSTQSTRFSTRSTRLSIRLFICSTRLSTCSTCLSTGTICLSTRSTRSTTCRSFYNWSYFYKQTELAFNFRKNLFNIVWKKIATFFKRRVSVLLWSFSS